MNPSEKIPQIQRLKSEKAIQHIFGVGQSLFIYPLKIQYKIEETASSTQKTNLQFGVSVSKKNFKRAVDRNLIKRRLRETFRTQKVDLDTALQEEQKNLKCMIIFVAKDITDYTAISASLHILIKKLLKKITKHQTSQPNKM